MMLPESYDGVASHHPTAAGHVPKQWRGLDWF